MLEPTTCNAGLNYFNCNNTEVGCCTVDPCSLPGGCPDSANCNGQLGEAVCGALCCPNGTACVSLGFSCEDQNGDGVAAISPSPTLTSTLSVVSIKLVSKSSTTSSTTSKPSISTLSSTANKLSADTNPTSQPGPIASAQSNSTPATTSLSGNTTLSSPTSSASTPASNSHGAAIGGAIGGVAGLILVAILIALVWRRRKTNGNNERIHADDERRMQGTDDNGEGGAIKTENGTNENSKSTRASIISILSPARRRRTKHSSNIEPSPVYAEMEEPKGNVSNPELPSDPPAIQVAELPAEPERPVINTPRRISVSSWTDVNSNAGTVETAGESPMSPNLDVAGDRRGRSASRVEHVMSFMNYNEKVPSPAR